MQNVSDARSNASDQIAHAAKVIGKAAQRTAVFKAIYYGKKRIKTVYEIQLATKLSRKRILEEAKKLAKNLIVKQVRLNNDTAYEKDSFYDASKERIIILASSRKKLESFATKSTPRIIGTNITINIPRQRIFAKMITVDDIDSFSKVRKISDSSGNPTPMLEAAFKNGVKKILRETGQFKDWGGEKNDLLTTRLRINGRRLPAAFAFKGRGKKGKLTPKQMGKNGDQIQRLFSSRAEVFIVQYWNQIDESVLEQMAEFAKAKSAVENVKIYYGIIDGKDSNRLIKAYASQF